MKRFIPLLALFAAGMVVSFAIAAPPPGKGKPTSSSSTSTTHGKSGEHGKSQAKCRPMNLKGTVADGMVALNVTKADPHSSQLLNTTANLTVKGNVSVQAWSCGAASGASSTAPALFLRQLHVGGSPQQLGSTTGTTGTTAGQCRPSNLKGTVAGGTITLNVTQAAGPHAKQLGDTATLQVSGKVSVQAWACGAAGANTAPTLYLKQLHVGGSPHNLGSTTTTTGP
jgi:hypothetical protein